MRQRCNNPHNNRFRLYGGRGVKICSRWNMFDNFLSDMGERPVGKTLDRNRTSGNYCPSNCSWADAKDQARNRRESKLNQDQVEEIRRRWPNETQTHLAAVFGVHQTLISDIVNREVWV